LVVASLWLCRKLSMLNPGTAFSASFVPAGVVASGL
jgi:hypothetical protein